MVIRYLDKRNTRRLWGSLRVMIANFAFSLGL
nr:MAG TPA: hypothetical protein [Caudoviricetes sp.]